MKQRLHLLMLGLMVILSLVSCSPRSIKVIRQSEVPERLLSEFREKAATAGIHYKFDESSKKGYLQISTGEENKRTLHLRAIGGSYKKEYNLMFVEANHYLPELDKADSEDWLLYIEFQGYKIDNVTVTVVGTSGDLYYHWPEKPTVKTPSGSID